MNPLMWVAILIALALGSLLVGHVVLAIAFGGWAIDRGQVVSHKHKELGY